MPSGARVPHVCCSVHWRVRRRRPRMPPSGCSGWPSGARRSTTPVPSSISTAGRDRDLRLVHLAKTARSGKSCRASTVPQREIIRSAARYAATSPTTRSFASKRARSAMSSRRCRPEQTATCRSITTIAGYPAERVAGACRRDRCVRAQGWHALRPAFLGRRGHRTAAAARSLVNERGEMVEQVAFTDVAVNAKIGRDMVQARWARDAADWQVTQASSGELVPKDTGWVVGKLPPGFTKINEGFRKWKGKPRARGATGVFRRPGRSQRVHRAADADRPVARAQKGGLNYYSDSQRRPAGDRARQGPGGDGAPDRPIGHPALIGIARRAAFRPRR